MKLTRTEHQLTHQRSEFMTSPVYVRYTYEHGHHGIPWQLSACANSVYQVLSPPPPPRLGTRLGSIETLCGTFQMKSAETVHLYSLYIFTILVLRSTVGYTFFFVSCAHFAQGCDKNNWPLIPPLNAILKQLRTLPMISWNMVRCIITVLASLEANSM